MFFNTSTKIESKLNADQVKSTLVGNHFQIKELDFEFKESEGIIKVIPHTENDERSRLVPITHVRLSKGGNGTELQVSSKPRRIDLGGLYLAVGAIVLLALMGIYLKLAYPEQDILVPAAIIVAALLAFILFRIKLQSSYYGYVNAIRKYIREQTN